MGDQIIRGVVPILLTPFSPDEEIDIDSLNRLVEFNVAAGVHGLGIALGSEIFKLTESERDLVTRTVVDQVAGRIPVIVNTGAAGTRLALHYCKRAQELGADAVMVTPPAGLGQPGPDETRHYYQVLSDAIQIPIVVQDHDSAPVSPTLLAAIAEDCEMVRYCKVETSPTPHRIDDALNKTRGAVGILGGAGGNFLLEELVRGSTGTMPSCSQPNAYVRIWDMFHEGKVDVARDLFYDQVLPLNRAAASGMDAFYVLNKQLLVRRGIIDHATVRTPAAPPDPQTATEIDEILSRILASESEY